MDIGNYRDDLRAGIPAQEGAARGCAQTAVFLKPLYQIRTRCANKFLLHIDMILTFSGSSDPIDVPVRRAVFPSGPGAAAARQPAYEHARRLVWARFIVKPNIFSALFSKMLFRCVILPRCSFLFECGKKMLLPQCCRAVLWHFFALNATNRRVCCSQKFNIYILLQKLYFTLTAKNHFYIYLTCQFYGFLIFAIL